MYILLIFWFLFLFVYIVYNIYGLFRVMQMRLNKDATNIMVAIYVIFIFTIIALSIIFISQLNWSASIRNPILGG